MPYFSYMDLSVLFAAFGITTLELSEAAAISIVIASAYKSIIPYLYAIGGALLVFLPTFLVGRYIVLLPIDLVKAISAVILAYFGYRLLRSARRNLRGLRKPKSNEKDEGMITAFIVGVIEALEASLVILALIPISLTSSLVGAIAGGLLVSGISLAIKDQVKRIRPPYLKLGISALLFTIATAWGMEVFTEFNDLYLIPVFLVYLGIDYVIIKYV